jgi:hypothetical protein
MPGRIRAGPLTSVWVQFSPWLFNVTRPVDAHGWVLLGDPATAAAGEPTHALFADQGQSIPDNLMALLSQSRAWNCYY